MFAIMAGIEDTREYIDVEDGQEMRNVPVRLCSPGFEHGALDLICIDGPLLDGDEPLEQESGCERRMGKD